MINNTLWVEKYRPQQLEDYVGNTTVIDTIKTFITNNDIPHLLFYGPAGTGKTTLAKIITNSIDCDVMYINASDENSVDIIRNKIKNFASAAGFRTWKVVILDECDYLTPNAMATLRATMEIFSVHTRFILTGNYLERIIEPIQSRCQSFKLIPPSKKDIAKRVITILTAENINYELNDISTLIHLYYPDVRKIINTSQLYSSSGTLKLDKEELGDGNYRLKILDELKNASGPNAKNCLTNIRQILASAESNSFVELYGFLYDNIEEFAKNHIAATILILAESQFQEPNALDKELHMAALFIKIISELNQ